MKSVRVSAAAFVLLLVLAPVSLMAQQRNIRLGVFASQVDMQGENSLGEGFETEFDDGMGFGASANLFLGRFFSVEAAVFNVRTDGALVLEDSAVFDLGTMSLTPISLGVQFHPLGGMRLDPYIGGGAAYVLGDDLFSSDLEFAGVGRIELENAVGYYINAGIAVEITEGLGIVIDGREIQYEPSSRSVVTGVEQDLELTPRILSAGLRLRF